MNNKLAAMKRVKKRMNYFSNQVETIQAMKKVLGENVVCRFCGKKEYRILNSHGDFKCDWCGKVSNARSELPSKTVIDGILVKCWCCGSVNTNFGINGEYKNDFVQCRICGNIMPVKIIIKNRERKE